MNFTLFPEGSNIDPPKRVKFGIDPTFPKLHLGHLIPLRLCKKMKEQGHKITIVLGTFTARMGDPSGRDTTRPILSQYEVFLNAQRIASKVCELLGETEFFLNGTLFEEMRLPDFFDIISQFSLANILARHGFQDRMEKTSNYWHA